MNTVNDEIAKKRKQIEGLNGLVNYLKSEKYSKGLNPHDIMIYENTKEELKKLIEDIKSLQDSKTYKIAAKM